MYCWCEKCYTPIPVVQYMAHCVSWIPRLGLGTNWTWQMCFWNGTCLYAGDLLCTTLSCNCQLTQLPFQPQCKILNDKACTSMGFPGGSVVKNPSTCQCRRHRFHPSVGETPGGGNGNPVQYSCLGNPMDREAWWATVHVGYHSCKRVRDDLGTKHLMTTCVPRISQPITYFGLIFWRINTFK